MLLSFINRPLKTEFHRRGANTSLCGQPLVIDAWTVSPNMAHAMIVPFSMCIFCSVPWYDIPVYSEWSWDTILENNTEGNPKKNEGWFLKGYRNQPGFKVRTFHAIESSLWLIFVSSEIKNIACKHRTAFQSIEGFVRLLQRGWFNLNSTQRTIL